MIWPFIAISPFNFLDLGMQQYKLVSAASETVWRRSSLYLRGTLSLAEAMSMWVEKPTALAKGFENAAMATARGKNPAAIAHAALAPMTAKASSNARRLRNRRS